MDNNNNPYSRDGFNPYAPPADNSSASAQGSYNGNGANAQDGYNGNSSYAQGGYNGNGANAQGSYNGNGSYNAPLNQYPPKRRRRSAGSVILCFFMGILILANIITISAKNALFSDKGLTNAIEKSGFIEEIKDAFVNEINSITDSGVGDSINSAADTVIDYYKDFIYNGKIPDKKDIINEINSVYKIISEHYVDELIKEVVNNGGEMSTNSLFKTDTYKELDSLLGSTASKELSDAIEDNFGNRISVNAVPKDWLKKELLNFVDESCNYNINELTDELYDSLVEFKDAFTSKGFNVQKLISEASNAISFAIAVLSVIIAFCILGTALIDKQAHVTLKGLFTPFFVPGLIVLLISTVCKTAISFLVSATAFETEQIKDVFINFIKIVTNPFIICSAIAVAAAIIFRIAAAIIKKSTEKNNYGAIR